MSLDWESLKGAMRVARLCPCLLEQGFGRLSSICAGVNADWASSTAVAAESPVLTVKDKDVMLQ